MNFFESMHYLLPEWTILITACLALIVDLFKTDKQSGLVLMITVSGLLLAALWLLGMMGTPAQILLGGLFVHDNLAILMKLFIVIVMAASFVYVRHYNTLRAIGAGDFYVLALFSTLGMMLLVSAHSLLMIYLGIELLSLPLYALVAVQRTHGRAIEGSLKYFVMGALASGILLYGISLLYGATGLCDLGLIAERLPAIWHEKNTMILFAMVFILAGLGFKLASVPFHLWVPDVYEGAPQSVVLLISSAPKIAGFAMAIRILLFGMPSLFAQWQQILIVMALLSAMLGNVIALVQTNIKRLLAYSAISHSGYALFGLIAGNALGYAATVYYVLIYALMSAAIFGFMVLCSSQDKEFETLDDLKGMNHRNPWLAFMLLVVLFSLAGVPPTAGFFAKLLVLQALVQADLLWIALVGLLFAVVGAFYYIRLVKMMYFDTPDIATPVTLSRLDTMLYSANALILIYLGVLPAGLIYKCMDLALAIPQLH